MTKSGREARDAQVGGFAPRKYDISTISAMEDVALNEVEMENGAVAE